MYGIDFTELKIWTQNDYNIFQDENVPMVVKKLPKPTINLPKVEHSIQGQVAGKSTSTGNKNLNFGKIVDNLLQKNNVVLAQHDLTPYKPRFYVPRQRKYDKSCDSVTPPSEEVYNPQNALVEVDLKSDSKNRLNPDIICAVASNMNLTNADGQVLSIDTVFYWCNFCSYRSEKIHELFQHVNSHRFCCQTCAFQSFSRSALLQHQVDEHGGGEDTSVKFCAFLSDVSNCQNTAKRKHSGDSFTEPDVKRKIFKEDVVIDYSISKGPADSNKNRKEVTRKLKDIKEPAPCRSKSVSKFKKNTPESSKIGTDSTEPEAKSVEILHSDVKIEPNDAEDIKNDLKITDVFSGQEAINNLFQCSTQSTSETLTLSEITSKHGITDLTTIALKCCFCYFSTFNEYFFKLHMNAKHPKKMHMFEYFLVSKMQRKEIIASDKQFASSLSLSRLLKTDIEVTSNSKELNIKHCSV